jgi:3-oxo-5-alpha-steroid 4-dehydrogenase 1
VTLYYAVLLFGVGLALLSALAGLFMVTPYGRFGSTRMGPTAPIRVGWLLMEAPAVVVFAVVYPLGSNWLEPVPLLFAAVWALHYGNRAVFFPLAMAARADSRMAVSVWGTGMVVTTMHAWLYASWFSRLGEHLTVAWLADPRFVVGLPMYLFGYVLIVHSEGVLRGLRRDGPGYRIPRRGAFRWVSSPHYLGEIIAWTGLMLASWCPGGLFVWAITLANLIPRARATHHWYAERFADYPAERKALVPFVW